MGRNDYLCNRIPYLKYVHMRFLGNIEAKTDSKGRAFLPAAFRKVLQAGGEERLVMRKDVFQPCLVLYPESVWNEQMDMLRQRLNRWNRQKPLLGGRRRKLGKEFLFVISHNFLSILFKYIFVLVYCVRIFCANIVYFFYSE